MSIQVDLPFDDFDENLDNPLLNSPLQGKPIRFGNKTIDFASEMEKALYVLASKPRGTFVRDKEIAEYLAQFGLGDKDIRKFGGKLAATIRYSSKSSGSSIDATEYFNRDSMFESVLGSSAKYAFESGGKVSTKDKQGGKITWSADTSGQAKLEARNKFRAELLSAFTERNQPTPPSQVSKSVKLFRGVGPGKDPEAISDISGLFMTPDEKIAAMYAGDGGTVVSKDIEFNNLFEADTWASAKEMLGLPQNTSMQDLVNTIKNQGYDGFSFNTSNGLEYVNLTNARNTKSGGGIPPNGPIDFIVDPADEEGPKINRSHIKQRAKSLEAQVLASLRRELGKDLEASRGRASEISAQASKSRAAGYSVGGLFGLPGYAFSTVADSLRIRPIEEALRGEEASYQGSRKDEFSEQTFKIKEFFRQYIFDAVDNADDEMLAGVEDALKSLEGADRANIFEGVSDLARGLVDGGLLDDRVRSQGTGDVEGLDPSQFRKTARPNTVNNAAAAFGPAGNLAKYSGYAVAGYAAIKAAQFVSSIPANMISNIGGNLNASSSISGQQGLLKNFSKLDPGTALGVNPVTKGLIAMFDVVSQIEENTRKEYAFTTPETLMQDAMNQILMIQRMIAEGAERDPILAELAKTRGVLSREAEGLKTELLKTFGPMLNDVLMVMATHIKIAADALSSPTGKMLLRLLMGGVSGLGPLLATWGAYGDAQLLAEAMKNNAGLLKDVADFLDDDYFGDPSNPNPRLDMLMNQRGRRTR